MHKVYKGDALNTKTVCTSASLKLVDVHTTEPCQYCHYIRNFVMHIGQQ